MKTNLKTLFLASFMLNFVNFSAKAQQVEDEKPNEFSLSAQIRPRFEYRNGAYKPLAEGEVPAILVNNRSRLNFEYKNAEKLSVFVSLQNVNVWGQAPQIQTIDKTGGMSIFEAYTSFPISKTISAKIGRQMIVLDDDRIFGSLDWHPAGRSHDAVNLNINANENLKIRSFFAFNQDYSARNINSPSGQYFNPQNAQPYQHLEAIHAHYVADENHNISFLFANLGFKDSTNGVNDENMQTFGIHYNGKKDNLKYGVSAYYQGGKNNLGVKKQAYLLAGHIGGKLSEVVSASLGVDYLSGKAFDDTSAIDKTFNPFSGTNHKFYGFMDYFYVPNPHQSGLLNPYLSANFKTSGKSDLTAAYHYFSSAAKQFDNHNYLGSEIDLVYTLKVQKFVSVQTGYSVYFKSKGVEQLKGVSNARGHQDWFWCSLNVNPKIFSAKF